MNSDKNDIDGVREKMVKVLNPKKRRDKLKDSVELFRNYLVIMIF